MKHRKRTIPVILGVAHILCRHHTAAHGLFSGHLQHSDHLSQANLACDSRTSALPCPQNGSRRPAKDASGTCPAGSPARDIWSVLPAGRTT